MEKKTLNHALRKQKLKMTAEGLLRALLIGAVAGGVAFIVLSWIYRIRVEEPPLWLILTVVLSAVGLFAALAFAIFFFPTKKRVARRVDDHGMDERVLTMLEYSQSNADAARLQREDTVVRLKDGKNVRTGFKITLKEVLALGLCGILVAVMFFIPYDIFAKEPEPPLEPEEQRDQIIIDELIKDLREIIEQHENDEAFEQELNQQVDELERELKQSTDTLERVAMINSAAEKLEQSFKQEQERNPEDQDKNRMLGEEKDEMTERMEQAKKQLLNDDQKITDEMIEALRQIVEENDNKEEFEKELNDHIDDLEKDFEKTVNPFEKAEMIEDMAKKLEESFEQERERSEGDEEMIAMLNEEEKAMLALMRKAEAELRGEEPAEEPGEEPGEQSGEGSEGSKPTEGGGGEIEEPTQGEGREPGGPGEGALKVFDETYFVGEGRMAYYEGETYHDYISAYIEAKINGEIPPELQKIMDEYFGELQKNARN